MAGRGASIHAVGTTHFCALINIMQSSLHKIRIRNLVIDPPLLMAPMAGITHSAFRQICMGFGGVGLLSTEMLSTKRLPSENPHISPFLIRTGAERPLSYQLLIASEGDVAPSIDILQRLGADSIDFNMGCPAPAVGRFGGGAMLMEQPEVVRSMLGDARKLTQLPLTAKIRLGCELDEHKLTAFCSMLEGEGIDMISVHARLKDEPFIRRPRWECIAGIKAALKIPVIANGGIFSVEDARECLRLSGADGLMPGRGAVTSPWLFAEIARELYGCEIPARAVSLPDVYENFIELLKELFRPERRLGRLKEFTHYFARNYKFGHRLAVRVQSSSSLDQARERACLFFENNG